MGKIIRPAVGVAAPKGTACARGGRESGGTAREDCRKACRGSEEAGMAEARPLLRHQQEGRQADHSLRQGRFLPPGGSSPVSQADTVKPIPRVNTDGAADKIVGPAEKSESPHLIYGVSARELDGVKKSSKVNTSHYDKGDEKAPDKGM